MATFALHEESQEVNWSCFSVTTVKRGTAVAELAATEA